MIEIINVDNCPYSKKHGSYGGASGYKDGIIINEQDWLVKYPKTTKDMISSDLR